MSEPNKAGELGKMAVSHEYFSRNPDLRMTTGDHASYAKRLRALASSEPGEADISVATLRKLMSLMSRLGYSVTPSVEEFNCRLEDELLTICREGNNLFDSLRAHPPTAATPEAWSREFTEQVREAIVIACERDSMDKWRRVLCLFDGSRVKLPATQPEQVREALTELCDAVDPLLPVPRLSDPSTQGGPQGFGNRGVGPYKIRWDDLYTLQNAYDRAIAALRRPPA